MVVLALIAFCTIYNHKCYPPGN